MSGETTRVIINADDFGLAPEVNAAVAQLCEAGIVRSTSLLVTGPAADEAMALARTMPGLGVGVHLAWVHERSAVGREGAGDFVDGQGLLPLGYREFMQRWVSLLQRERDPARLVRNEAVAQLDTMVAAGLRPTHLDSHQHLHLWPPLFALSLDLCREYRIPFIRLPGMGALETGGLRVAWLRRWLMRGLIGRVRRQTWIMSGVRHADEVWGMLAAGHLDEGLLRTLLAQLPPGLHEIMCHPATGACDQYTRHSWGYDWAREYEALGGDAVREQVGQGLVLTNYREMAGTGH